MPETVDQCKKLALPGQGEHFAEQMLDIHGERLEIMTKHNVEYFVLSLASPGPQGQSDREKAEVRVEYCTTSHLHCAQALARRANDYMAEQVAKNPKRFGGFCVLSMHDPKQAAQELRRAVTELGLKGAIINDFQSAGPDGETMLLYDQSEYDPFWATVQVRGCPNNALTQNDSMLSLG